MPEILDEIAHKLRHTDAKSIDFDIEYARQIDTDDIKDLLKLCGYNPIPPIETYGGLGLRIRDKTNNKLIGYIWALVGDGSIAYVDFLAVHPDYRMKDVIHGYKISLILCELMSTCLKNLNIPDAVIQVPAYKRELVQFYEKLGLKNFGKHYTMFRIIN